MRGLVVLLLSIVSLHTFAQHSPRQEVDVQAFLDAILSAQDEDANYEELYENYLHLLSHPLPLNTASGEQLRSLSILSELQIQELLRYRNENGKLLSEYELQTLTSFDSLSIQRLLPFITVTDPRQAVDKSFLKRVVETENTYLLVRYERGLQNKKGFKDTTMENRFQGSPDKYYLRFRSSLPNDFSIGFTAEQDAGEQLIWQAHTKRYGVDFLSFHAQVQNKGRLKNLIVGDYQLQSGQGLVFGGAFGGGKGGESISTVRKSTLVALPFTSAAENFYLRGLTATYSLLPHLTYTPFFSRTHRDANRARDSLETEVVSSFLLTGLHRNNKEVLDRKQLAETLYGSMLRYQQQSLDIGVLHQSIRFDKEIVRTPTPYNQFAFEGKSNSNYAIYANYSRYNFTFFSEVAKSSKGGTGLVAGMLGSLTNDLDLALLFRNYQRNFYSFYSNALAEASTPQNERGFYAGLKYRFSKQFHVSGYLDFFEFPWLRYRSYTPSTGHEWLVRLLYQRSKTVSIMAQWREESKQRNIPEETTFYLTDQGTKRNLFLQADYAPTKLLHLKTRLQYSTYEFNQSTTQGMAAFQDITLDFRKWKVSGRYALVDTDDYDNRHYLSEKDVWMAYSFPSYSGKGMRTYVLLQYEVNKHLTCWIRYAYLRVANVESIGSNLDEIEGNEKTDLKFQLRIKF